MLWVYGGNIARYYQGYKRIAQLLEIEGWDDPAASILELVCDWFSGTKSDYLLVIDNADNVEHWWPGMYKTTGSLGNPSVNFSDYIPKDTVNSHILITTRDSRVARPHVSNAATLAVEPMTKDEAKVLLRSKLERKDFGREEDTKASNLLEELDYIPLAISQAAAFIMQNRDKGTTIANYVDALRGGEADEFLHEELHDTRRHMDSANSVARTWLLSYKKIEQQKPRAAELLCFLAMFDRQSIPMFILKLPELITSLGVLQAFNLVTSRAGSQSFQIHRLVQRFVHILLQRNGTLQKWQAKALACVSEDYPTEIGVAEWPICDALAPHVHVLTGYRYETTEARLDLAHLLCWAADFDIERGMYKQALRRARQSLELFTELVDRRDERLVASTWLYGRLRYYEAQSTADLDAAAGLLERSLKTSKYPSLNYAESAFELAHLYYDQCNQDRCLKMGKASYECWAKLEGPNSVRTLDNLHDYALELAMLGKEADGIAMWQEILDRCPASDAAENTKTVFKGRSIAGIAEFQGDSAVAEDFYAKLITICEGMYHPDHVHVFDYRLSHAEQVMRQGRLDEAIALSEAILGRCDNTSEWRIRASCLQTIAECHRLSGDYNKELLNRQDTLELHERKLGPNHKETVDATEALADCFVNKHQPHRAMDLYVRLVAWRTSNLGKCHADTVRAVECLGICHANMGHALEAETAYIEAIDRLGAPSDPRLLNNLYFSLIAQAKWEMLESWSRWVYSLDETPYVPGAYDNLIVVPEKRGETEELLQVREELLVAGDPQAGGVREKSYTPIMPPVRDDRRFGRMVHPRTWSA